MTMCPVCGYPELPDRHIGEYCDSCGFQFHVSDHDKGFTYEQWRNNWINKGMPWSVKGVKTPPNWDPKQQLENLVSKT